jgi:hypothetical protein
MPRDALDVEVRKSSAVVEVDFVSATITLEQGDPIESGVVRVRRSFKGAFKPGELIRTRSNISGAACGYSLRGTPPAALDVIDKSTHHAGPYWKWGAYDSWVLFLSGAAPFEVSTCSRSLPSELFKEFPELLRLQKASPVPAARLGS